MPYEMICERESSENSEHIVGKKIDFTLSIKWDHCPNGAPPGLQQVLNKNKMFYLKKKKKYKK